MKKMIGLLVVSGLLATSLSAKDRTSITLATEDWAPFSFNDKKTKQISGLSTEIINGTFKLMNIEISSNKVLPWARTQEMGFKGKYDAVYTASINDERKALMYFPAEPIVSSKWVLFSTKAKKAELKFDSYESLNGKNFCLITGYNYPKDFISYIEKNAKSSFVATEDLSVVKLLRGRCDYMPAVLETTLENVKSKKSLKKINAYDKIFYFDKSLSVSDFYLMFSKKTVSQSFVDKFSKALVEFKTTNEYKSILKKYL